ncbi:unnamed protein product [Vitrella brassicaformis CCMP3155]|uniref:Transmembrane 9 superfamily member n=1 Tax=Vitrella brassicaformis (strain CCMP3155) TaxID=1169540 RepID=A0A0G4EFF6_VITBC|nr:unnamed protein product [Vitrella brassicaformis CCMP3155]|eukprot:CEL94236.1 unnamed protein product [Vitrella brassicaformis CCMP3155]
MLRRAILRGQICLLASLAVLLLWQLPSSGVVGLETGEQVTVSMNKVWPINNPTEMYPYYSLPFCTPPEVQTKYMTFGQIMRGDRLVNSLYNINYRENQERKPICERALSEDDVDAMRNAIENSYMFEIFVADLPVVRPLGIRTKENGQIKYWLVNNMDFNLGYNEGQVVAVNITTDVDLFDITQHKDGMKAQFSYSVNWFPSTIPASSRLQQQLAGSFTHHTQSLDIHWLAIINSFVLVLLIVSLLLLIILRVVRSDLSKYLHIPDEELTAGGEEESGWKLLHADVFRAPQHRMWFCALVGAGAQLFLMVIGTVLVGTSGLYLFERGGVLTFAFATFLVTAFLAGYLSAWLYRKLGGQKWAWNIVITAMMFVGPLFVIWSFLNSVAWAHQSTAALPFTTVIFLFFSWSCVTVPLTVLGGIMGRSNAAKWVDAGQAFPCKTNKLAREIPQCHWYHAPLAQMFASGFLPFSAIYIELHYVFSSVWGTKIYTLYGILLLTFVMLLLVASTVSVLLTYFHLNAEDHRWWWRSFGSGGSVSLFFYVYCIYYFFTSTRMFGFLQCSFFFGYSLLVAWGIFLMMGFVTFISNFVFVNYIYSRIKSD